MPAPKGGKVRLPSIKCPDCGSRMQARTSSDITATCREIQFRCNNDDCGGAYVAQLEIIRIVRPSDRPNPDIHLPLTNQNNRLAQLARRQANDNFPAPANDAAAGDEEQLPMNNTG